MNENYLRTEYVLASKQGQLSFPSLESLEKHVNVLKENCPDYDYKSLRVFTVKIYHLEKSF